MSKLIQVIETTSKRGRGVPGDPVRVVTEYWSTDGILLAEIDHEKRKRFDIELREHLNKDLAGEQLTVNGYVCGMIIIDNDTRRRFIEQIEAFNNENS